MGSPLETAKNIISVLRHAGHQAYLVGGSVRDMVRGAKPHEFDIVTSATPEIIKSLFPRTVSVGAAFGVMFVLQDSEKFEVATFRTEKGYKDGRRPSEVEFPAQAEEDVQRRDFTINGLLMDTETGQILDYVGGLRDIHARLIRTIGKPTARFSEDHLRMMRAVRFAANLDFEIDPATMKAIRDNAEAICRISAERVRDELTKILTGCNARRGIELLSSLGLLALVLPEISVLHGIDQPPRFHPEGNVWEHTLKMLGLLSMEHGGRADPRLAWGVLLHDSGKAVSRSEDESGIHFYGHSSKGRTIGAEILRRLRFSNAEVETIEALVEHHMQFLDVMEMKQGRLKKFLRMPDFGLHLELHRLDSLASNGSLKYYDFCRKKLAEMGVEELRPPRLISGRDLIEMGFRPSPVFAEILKALEEAQLDGELKTAEQALRYVLEHWGAKLSE